MNQLPMRPLGELATLIGGGTPSRDKPEYWDGDVLWITPTDLPMPELGISNISTSRDQITELGLSSSSATLLPVGAVLFSSRATIGKVAVADGPLATNQGFANFVPGPEVTSRYLAYCLWHRREDITRLSGSTTFKEVSRGTLRKYQVPVPPLAEQERIVRMLDEADAIRKLRAQADQRTADLIPALFHDMFGDPITNPMGWPVQRLGDLVKLVSGGTPSRTNAEYWNGSIPWVSPKDMKSVETADSLEHVTEAALDGTTLKMIPESTVLIVVRGMILAHTVPVGITRVPVTINQDMKALLPVQSFNSTYLAWALRAQHRTLLSLVSTAGHGTKRLDSEELEAILILVPPSELQAEFEKSASLISATKSKQLASNAMSRAASEAIVRTAFAPFPSGS